MTGSRDRQILIELSASLPEDLRSEPVDFWDHDEGELAVEILADMLSDRHAPLGNTDRARLVNLADRLGVSARVQRALKWCPNPDDEDPPWRVVEDTGIATTIVNELAIEIGPDHPLHGRQLIAWLGCNTCDDILLSVDERGRAAIGRPTMFAVVHPTWSGRQEAPGWPTTSIHETSNDALEQLMRCNR